MLHHGYITLQEFQAVNNVLLENEEDDEDEDDKESLIRSTTEFMIKRDKDTVSRTVSSTKSKRCSR